MKLKAGEKAPDFTSHDIFENEISIEKYRGKKIMLSFYRYASCPFCNLRMHSLIEKYEKYHNSGLEMVAVFQSPKENILKYVGKQNAPFPVISDPSHKLYSLYDVKSSWFSFCKAFITRGIDFFKATRNGFYIGKTDGKKAQVPADFLIDETGDIYKVYYGKDIGDHLPLEIIEEWISKR